MLNAIHLRYFHTDDVKANNEKEFHKQAEALYNAGYRKASEVAREIFEEIEEAIDSCVVTEHFKGSYFELNKFMLGLAELKKKYTEGCDG